MLPKNCIFLLITVESNWFIGTTFNVFSQVFRLCSVSAVQRNSRQFMLKKNCTKQQIKLVSSAPDVLYGRYAQKDEVSRFCIQVFGFLLFLVHIQEEYVNT
jgi:hypothetical protein